MIWKSSLFKARLIASSSMVGGNFTAAEGGESNQVLFGSTRTAAAAAAAAMAMELDASPVLRPGHRRMSSMPSSQVKKNEFDYCL